MKSVFLFIVCLLFLFASSFAQGTDVRYSNNKLSVGASLMPCITSIHNQDVYNAANTSTSSLFNLNGSVHATYYFAPFVGFSFGFGYSQYSTKLSMPLYFNSYDSVDSENDAFEMRIEGRNISEEQKISFLTFPVQLVFQYYFSRAIGVYARPGFILSYVVLHKYISRGTIDYNAYYPEYNITLYNLPEYGFPGNVDVSNSDDLDLKSFQVNFGLSTGIIFKLNSKTQMSVGGYYSQSLANASKSQDHNYHLSRRMGDYEPLMKSCSNVGMKALGTEISIYYFIR